MLAFFVLAFGITRAVWVPRAANLPVGAVGQLWTWAPTGAALLAAALPHRRARSESSNLDRGILAGSAASPDREEQQ